MAAGKKVKLLTDADRKAGPKRPATAEPQPQFAPIPDDYKAPKPASRWGIKLSVLLVVGVLAALIVLPKPAVLHYNKDGIATKSVYWGGFMHYPAQLFDSELSPAVDNERQELTLCDGQVIKDGQPTCSIYHIEKMEGMMAAWKLYRQTH